MRVCFLVRSFILLYSVCVVCVCVCVRTLDSQTLKKMPSQWGHLKWSSLFETYKSAYFLLNGHFRFGRLGSSPRDVLTVVKPD